jgi:predicted nucleic acid-binding protein
VTGSVLVDTNVFTAWLRGRSRLTSRYAKHLLGRSVAVSPQTIAEARYGALKAGWGPRRLRDLAEATERARILPVDLATVETVAELRNRCRLIGHALHQRGHNADLWIAATAIHWAIPLVAHDAVFISCPGLDLRTEVDT